MKKKAVWIIGALAVVGLVLFIMAHTTLAKQINKKLDAPKAWNVVSVEKMDVDKDPVLHDIKADSATYGELVKEIEKTNMKWVRMEVGMEIKEPLYTMTVSSEEDYMTFTVNNDNEIHINQTNSTYRITNEKSKLYKLLETAYAEAK